MTAEVVFTWEQAVDYEDILNYYHPRDFQFQTWDDRQRRKVDAFDDSKARYLDTYLGHWA